VTAQVRFLETAFGMKGHRVSEDFAILTHHGQVFQLHADHTYGAHPLLGLLPEAPPRGAGIEIRLYETDPDEAAARAGAAGGEVEGPVFCRSDRSHRPRCPADARGGGGGAAGEARRELCDGRSRCSRSGLSGSA